MISGISSSGGYMSQMQGMRQRPNAGERFNQLDADKNGSIDQTELQALSDQVSAMTGQQLNIAETSQAYDANGDGMLAKDEMQAMMMDFRSQMKPPQGGGNSMQALTAYQSDSDSDPVSILLDALDGQDDEQEGYAPLNTQA